jgi:aminoglycoside phosphotransferase (APT) family kinase protein
VSGRAGFDSPPHGFCDDEETRALLRSRPPSRALAWAGESVGGTVTSARAMRGGTSSAVHALSVRLRDDRIERVVLRRYVRPELNEDEPDTATREASVLRFLEAADLPTPRLLAVDPSGSSAGVPSIVMSRVPGRVDWFPSDVDRWLRRLAELLPRIHAVPVPRSGGVRPYAPEVLESDEPPRWARSPTIWKRAVEIYHGPAPDHAAVFIQRDFHPGNVLWRRGAVTGLVDWQAASVGPPWADVAHCRVNLFRYGLDVADRFTEIWVQLAGRPFHPWAEVTGIIGFLEGWRGEPPSDSDVIEEALARAVAELGRAP